MDDLSLTVPAGKICVFVGPSGCGKTTSLKMVNRLIEPSSGQILIGGRDVMAQDPIELRRGIGYVIQQVGLLPHLTVGDNVAIVPRLLGWERARIAARVDELLALTGLAPGTYRERYPAQLSGGERQRVAIALALANEPRLLLADELTGELDSATADQVMDFLSALNSQRQLTLVVVTHNPGVAARAGRQVSIVDGRLSEVTARPARRPEASEAAHA